MPGENQQKVDHSAVSISVTSPEASWDSSVWEQKKSQRVRETKEINKWVLTWAELHESFDKDK